VRVAFVPRSAEIKPLFWRFVSLHLIFYYISPLHEGRWGVGERERERGREGERERGREGERERGKDGLPSPSRWRWATQTSWAPSLARVREDLVFSSSTI
jgi:hypothetical protein